MRLLSSIRRRPTVAALALFTILTLALTYPLVTHLTTHVPGSATWAFDEYTFLWSAWWFKTAALNLHSSPLHTNLLFYPLGLDLILYTYNFFHAVLGLPLQLAGNIPLASNLMLWFATVMSGYGAFLLTRWLLRPTVAGQPAPLFPALLAGLIYAFGANRAIYQALGHYNIASVQWLPFALLYFLKTTQASARAAWRQAALAGLFTGFLLLTDMTFAVFLVLALLVLLPLQPSPAATATAGRGGRLARQLAHLTMAGGVAALVSGYLLLPTVREMLGGRYGLEGWGDALKLSNDLASFITPVALHPLWGQTWPLALRAAETGSARFSDVNTGFVGIVTLALALVGALTAWRRARAWASLAVLSALLSLGPLLQINGQWRFGLDNLLPEGVTFPLPFALLHYLPFINANRTPNRFSIPLLLALAVLAALGSQRLIAGVAKRWPRAAVTASLSGLLAAAVLFEHLAWPLPLTDTRAPAVYEQLAQEPGSFAVLQLPLGWRNGFRVFGSEDTRVQWYQHLHGQPIIGGNAVRNPPFKFDYFERLPLFQALTGLEMYQAPTPALDQAARQQAAGLMTLLNVRYLVVNPPVPGRYPYVDTWQATRDYALQILPLQSQPVFQADGVQVYRVQAPPPALPFVLDFGAQDTLPYRGADWDVDEADLAGASAVWITGRQTELFLPVQPQPGQALRLTLRITPYSYAGAPVQTLAVAWNGRALGQRDLTPGWQALTFDVPADAIQSGPNTVTLRNGWIKAPREAQPETALIGATGVRAPVIIEAHAFSEAFITLTGPDGSRVDASAGRRGINLAVLNEQTGALLDKRGFDTAANDFEAEALAAYLAQVPAGRVVVVATKGEAARHLTAAARSALARLGVAADLSADASLAAVGVQGAGQGRAAQALAPGDAYLKVGGDARPLAAAVDWVRIE